MGKGIVVHAWTNSIAVHASNNHQVDWEAVGVTLQKQHHWIWAWAGQWFWRLTTINCKVLLRMVLIVLSQLQCSLAVVEYIRSVWFSLSSTQTDCSCGGRCSGKCWEQTWGGFCTTWDNKLPAPQSTRCFNLRPETCYGLASVVATRFFMRFMRIRQVPPGSVAMTSLAVSIGLSFRTTQLAVLLNALRVILD